jgi:hypothetical protein
MGMPIEIAIAKEVEPRQFVTIREFASPKSLLSSRSIGSAIIFLVLVASVIGLIPHRERIDFLIRKMSADCWCPRFERFLCSSSKPDILLLSSSIGFVPSMMSDIKNGAVAKPIDLVQFQRLSVNYSCPASFLCDLAGRGVTNVSAAHMGIPTANIADDLMLLRKAVAYGKKPKIAILTANVRDFVVPSNWPAIDKVEEPIKLALHDIPPMPQAWTVNRLARDIFVYARPGFLARCFDDARFYFSYEVYCSTKMVPYLKNLFGHAEILHNRMTSGSELDNHYDAKSVETINQVKLDPQTQNKILALRNKNFEDKQFDAFSQIVAFAAREGIKLVIVKAPLYPGMHAPSVLTERYNKAIATVLGKDVLALDLNDRFQFSGGQFIDLLHLNGLGGERLFWRIADFVAAHKTELFTRQSQLK